MSKILSHVSSVLLVMALVTGVITAGSLILNKAQPAYASCSGQVDYPNTAVIYCGLTGNSANAYAQDLKVNYYDKNTDGRIGDEHHDIQSFFNGKGLTGSVMTDGNWAMAHMDLSTKHIILNSNNSVVGTATAVYARCTSDGDPHCPISQSGTIMSTPDFYFGKFGNSMPTIVHMKADGTIDFALETPCGNFIVFTPTPPKTSLVCQQLDSKLDSQQDTSFNYTFTVTAAAQNTSNISYTIDFGDGNNSSKSVTNGQTVVSFDHTYAQLVTDKDYTVSAKVNNQPQVPTCQKLIHIPGKGKLTFACQQLTGQLISVSEQNGVRAYNFTANVESGQGIDTVQATNGYQLFYSEDNGAVNSFSSQTSNVFSNTTFHYTTTTPHSFKVYFVATSTTGLTTDVNDKNCQFTFSTALVRTGPEDTLAIVAGTSALGYGLHQFWLRRRS